MNQKEVKKIEQEYGLRIISADLIHQGKDNDVYVLNDQNRKKYVWRIGKRREKNFDFEVELLRNLERSGFEAPRMILSKNGRSGSLFDFIEGRQFEKVSGEMLADGKIEAGGRKLGQLHRITHSMQINKESNRTIFTEFERLLKIDIKNLERFNGYEVLRGQVEKFYAEGKKAAQKSNLAFGIIHNDYRIQNLIFTNEGSYLIDFDWACSGPLIKDVGLALAEWSLFAPESGPSKEAIEQFLTGYNSVAPFRVDFNSDAIFWICFACLSDACTFFADIIEERYLGKEINAIRQCRMYIKFRFFMKQIDT